MSDLRREDPALRSCREESERERLVTVVTEVAARIFRPVRSPRSGPGPLSLPPVALPRAARKDDGSLLTELALTLHHALEAALAERWPGIPFLGEESPADVREARAASPPFWCVDPLDGTTNLVAGFPFVALSVARIMADGPDLAVVLDPIRHEAFSAARGEGAFLNEERLLAHDPGALADALALVDTKRLTRPLQAALASAPPFRSQRNLGAAALEWAWLAAGRAHLLVHGAHHPWDHSAGRLLLSEAGGAFQLKRPAGFTGSSEAQPGPESAPKPEPAGGPASEARPEGPASNGPEAAPSLGPTQQALGPTGLAPAAVRAAGSPALLARWIAWLDHANGSPPVLPGLTGPHAAPEAAREVDPSPSGT